MAEHWPRFNGKLPEDMTFEEINEYIEKDDLKSLKNIILYSRGYLPIIQLSNALVKHNNLETIKVLLYFLPETAETILSDAYYNNSLDVIKYTQSNYIKNIDKQYIKYLLNYDSNQEIMEYLNSFIQ